MPTCEFIHHVQAFIEAHALLNRSDSVLVALSGGADSVALLLALRQLGYTCQAAHCNFHLRGLESMRDECFVRELCQRLDVTLHVEDFDVVLYQRQHHASVEMACRALRYRWFDELLLQTHCQAIAVAHHHDDNLETMLLNLLRGTGIDGLAGMRPKRGHVVRPLLCVSRGDVEAYLADCHQPYVTDSTNLESHYARNRIRNIVLPAIEREFPDARRALTTTLRHLGGAALVFDQWKEQVIAQTHAPGGFQLAPLLQQPALTQYLLHELLKDYGFSMAQCAQMEQCLRSRPSGKPVFRSKTHALTLLDDSGAALIEPLAAPTLGEQPIDEFNTSNLDIDLSIEYAREPFTPSMCDGRRRVAFSCELLQCKQLTVRPWARGDRMRPFGMTGRRLVSDILTNARYTREQKRAARMLVADGQIIWAIGVRAADAFRVQPGSTNYLLLTYNG